MAAKKEVKEQVEVMKDQTSFEQVIEETTDAMINEDALKSAVAKIMEEARAAAAKIINEAQAAAETLSVPTTAAGGNDPYYEEYVPIQLFKDGDKYKDDVFVAVNGESCLIQRGKPVQIKRKFALALENSQLQDIATADMISGLEDEYRAKEDKLTTK